MEMEMRATDDIEMAEDITPPLSPIASALHEPFLPTHCSSCFSSLPNPPHFDSNSFRYCSTKCSNFDSATAQFFSTHHFPSSDTADLRASFRILHLVLSNSSVWHSGPPERIFGLLTNREKLMLPPRRELDEDEDELLMRIKNSVEVMAYARSIGSADKCYDNGLVEAVLCLVLTNAVEVQNTDGRTIGIAVYDHSFCWINHSCSANACYRFSLPSPAETILDSAEMRLRIAPSCIDHEAGEIEVPSVETCLISWQKDYGPKIIVRAIKMIKKGEAVTIAYTDMLQPKAMRQSELWSRYRFVCCCQRCSAKPPTYVDHALQEISAAKMELCDPTSIINYDNAVKKINDYVDDAIADYLSNGSPESCCEKLENILTLGFCDEQVKDKKGKQLLNLKLHPLHHISLNAYTALASAYKVRSSDLLASSSSTTDEIIRDAFAMSRTSAAYSLFVAGTTNHLFLSEPSLIASAANCWVIAGESLLNLGRSSLWTNFSKPGFLISNIHIGKKTICSKCPWIDKFNSKRKHSRASSTDFDEFAIEYCKCIGNIARKIWSFLANECHYLKGFKDPFDLDLEAHNFLGSSCEIGLITSSCESQVYYDEERESIFELGFHCLLYGGYLASLCYGQNSNFTCTDSKYFL